LTYLKKMQFELLNFDVFRDYNEIDLPKIYVERIRSNAKVHLTRYTTEEMFKFLTDNNVSYETRCDRVKLAMGVSDVINGKEIGEFFDFSFSMHNRRIMCLLPVEKPKVKEVITTYIEAKQKGVIKSYFGKHDWLKIAQDQRNGSQYDYKYSNDYSDFLSSFNKMYLVECYLRWLRENNATLPIKDNDYSNPLNFVDYFFRQIGQYMDIIRHKLDRKYFIVGDGPGTASVACMLLGVNYFSYEPNDIGSKAREISLITSRQRIDPDKDDIVFLANVGPYVDYNEYLDYDRVIVDYSGVPSDIKRSNGGRGSVYATYDISLVSFPRRSSCLGLLKDKKVNPQTDLAYQMCVENGIEVSKEAQYKVTTDEYSDEFNMVSMEKPSDKRARIGHVKMYKGVFFYYYDDDQEVFYTDGYCHYQPLSYGSLKYVTDYYVDGNVIHAKSVRPEKVCGIILDDGRIEKLFFISKYENDKHERYGIFKSKAMMFQKNED